MWPTPQDYNEAVQQPHVCFSDLELRRCRVELNHLGLPRPMTGAFASVYRLSNVSGKSWAVRCFLEHREDMKERYKAIKNAIHSAKDVFADFEFIERGIKVRSDWYPILRMDWVEGDSLDRYLDRHVKTRAKVANLHKQFRDLIAKLRKAGIAHGDLQHGNILVTEEGLRLIDYDDMYVDGLGGKASHELGHRNFQHPDRQHDHFNMDLDNYSTWVIDLSLKALVVDPDIWRDFNGGDDCLLFRHKDFREPDQSPLLKALTGHDASELRDSAKLFCDMLKLNPNRVPEYQSDSRVVGQLIHLQSVELITEAETKIFGPGETDSSDGGDAKSAGAAPDSSFVDYDRWLASVEQRKQPARRSFKALDRLMTAFAVVCRRVWRMMVSQVAPYSWARGVADEANKEFDEGNFPEAVKLYTEAFTVLCPPDKERTSTPAMKSIKSAELLCEILVSLGYCHVHKEQLGTAAHYFSESKSQASKKVELGQAKLQATLLLAATYFDLDQRERAFRTLKEGIDTAEILIGAVRVEKDGPFGSNLSLPALLTELGHSYLAADDYANAQSAYKAGMEACKWITDERQTAKADLIIARAACGYCSTRVAEGDVEDALKQFCELIDVEDSADTLLRLIRTELRGPLKADWKLAELMRALGHYLDDRGKHEQAELAYSAGLAVFRLCDDGTPLQLKIADCLLGLGKSMEAVAVIRDESDWPKLHSESLSVQIARIEEFWHALVVSTVVFDDDIQKHRYRCLDALVNGCPGPDSFEKAVIALESSELGEKLAFAELMLELARELKKTGRHKVAKCAYAAAFKALKRADVGDGYGASVMECLLAIGDLDVSAKLLIEGGKLEDMVRLMVNVMVSQKEYDRAAICELMVKVADLQMAKPAASVTEDEVKQTIDLLIWCAGDDKAYIAATREKAERWIANREIAFAHSLVEQGQYNNAITIFERHEGANGPNALLASELWILRQLSAALIDRDRGFVTMADGYSFKRAIDMLADMRDKHALTAVFALKVSELIRSSRIFGAEMYVGQVYEIFLECGRGFEHAVLNLRDCLPPDARARIERRLNIKGNEDVHISISDGNFELAIVSPGGHEADPDPNATDAWRQLRRTYFLIDTEDYGNAVVELNNLLSLSSDHAMTSDALVLRGYCQFMLQEEQESERSFKLAVRAARKDRFRYDKASLCIALMFRRNRDKQRFLRALIDPTIGQRDVVKIATQMVGNTMSVNDNLADVMATDLFIKAEKVEKAALTSIRIFRATLAVYGVKNEKRRLRVVYCLDAIGKQRAAALVLKHYVDKHGEDEGVTELVAKLARRHIKTVAPERMCQTYKVSGIEFQQHIVAAQEDHLVGSLSKVIAGHVPRRLLFEVRQDLVGLYGRGKLTNELCARLAQAIEQGITGDTAAERRERFLNDLLGIARVIEKIDAVSASAIRTVLDKAAMSGTANGDSSSSNPMEVEEELFQVADK